jgi:exportin-1
MGPPNATWQSILSQAAASPDILKQQDLIRNVQNILQTNMSVCSSVGQPFLTQLSRIYLDMLKLYRYVHDDPVVKLCWKLAVRRL